MALLPFVQHHWNFEYYDSVLHSNNSTCIKETLQNKSKSCLLNEYEPDCGDEVWDSRLGYWFIFNSVIGCIGNFIIITSFSSAIRGDL